MNNNFFVIVHADRLHQGKHNEFPGTEYFRKIELIASILEQRLFNQSKKVIEAGGHVYFMGTQPDYLKGLSEIQYIPYSNNTEQFGTTARLIQENRGTHVLVAGVYSFACVEGFIKKTRLHDLGITTEVDPNLTEQFFDDYEKKTEKELQNIFHREGAIQIDPTISRK